MKERPSSPFSKEISTLYSEHMCTVHGCENQQIMSCVKIYFFLRVKSFSSVHNHKKKEITNIKNHTEPPHKFGNSKLIIDL